MMKESKVVEVKDDIVDFGDEQVVTYYIRKMAMQLNSQYVNFFGKKIETIKNLSIVNFRKFMSKKRSFEKEIIDSKPIIVTTIGKACTDLLRNRKFKRVIMDEATMIKENEAFLGAIHAE